MVITGYAGTYPSPGASGTYRFTFDAEGGVLSAPTLLYPQENTKYAAWSGGLLATLTQSGKRAGVTLLDAAAPGCPVVAQALDEEATACFLTWHEGLLYSANYHDGHVLIYSPEGGGLRLIRRLTVGAEAGCHQALFHGRWLLVPCLCLDQVRIFNREGDFALAGMLEFPSGTGPRHGVFNGNHTRMYLVSETNNRLFTYGVDGLTFTLLDTAPLLPPDCTQGAQTAAVRLSAQGRFLYVSVRGADLICVFQVDEDKPRLIQRVSSQGRDPWDMLLTPDGGHLLVSDRNADALVCFALGQDGRVGPERSRITIPQCVGLALE